MVCRVHDPRHSRHDARRDHRPWLGLIAGGLVLLSIMALVAGAAVALGWFAFDGAGRPDLRRWLQLEIAAGSLASVLAGAVSRRVAGSSRGPALLAWFVLGIGLLEAAAITALADAARVQAPGRWPWVAPFAGSLGVLCGGWLADRRAGIAHPRARVTRGEALRYALPIAVLASAALLARHALPGLEGADLQVASVALSFDLTVTVPGLVYLLLVRTRRAPWIVLLPAFALGYALALATIPPGQRTLLDALRWGIVPAELALLSYLVVAGRRALRAAPATAGDFATRVRGAARAALKARVPADILATEVAILHHALRVGRAAREGAGDYTSHRGTGYGSIVLGLVLLLLVEVFPLHVLVSRWSDAAAWVLTALSLYALLWLVGDLRAMSARPTRLWPERLSVRLGLRWEAEIPIETIDRVEAVGSDPIEPGSDRLVLTLVGPPNVRLRLNAPVEVTGMYGIRRTTRDLWLQVDRVSEFREAVRAARARGHTPGPGSGPSTA
jgi:hypothetical protein